MFKKWGKEVRAFTNCLHQVSAASAKEERKDWKPLRLYNAAEIALKHKKCIFFFTGHIVFFLLTHMVCMAISGDFLASCLFVDIDTDHFPPTVLPEK